MPYLFALFLALANLNFNQTNDSTYETRSAAPSKISIHWKDRGGRTINNFYRLKQVVPDATYAVNGGMFMASGLTPSGLLVQDGKALRPVKILKAGKLNFSMQPQGVFAITKKGKAVIDDATQAKPGEYNYATQSAPILVIKGKINPKLTKSSSKNIRNGVGVLADGRVIFVMSKWTVTFQEFAQFFIDKKCTSAMYLDGAISQTCDYSKEIGDPYNALGVFIAIK
jgi:uncharacterized protein YigE (DUF2233 family)